MLRRLRLVVGALVTGLVLAACGGGEGANTPAPMRQQLASPTQMTATGLDTFFSWAAGAFPQYFSGATQDGTLFVDGYGTFSYRQFGSGNYLAVLGDAVYAYGWITHNTILRVGVLNDFTCSVYPGNTDCASLAPAQMVSGNLASMDDQGNHTTYLVAGIPYVFTAMSPTLDTYLSIYAPDGTFVKAGHDPGPGLNATVWYTPSTSGLYTLRLNSAQGSGLYVLHAYFHSNARDIGSFITWPGIAGPWITDSTAGDNFSFDAASRCLYSWNRQEILTNFCLDPGNSSGIFAGQPVTVGVAWTSNGCRAVLVDPSGYRIEIDMSGMIPTAAPSRYWTRTDCT